jgi:hypothetical protein
MQQAHRIRLIRLHSVDLWTSRKVREGNSDSRDEGVNISEISIAFVVDNPSNTHTLEYIWPEITDIRRFPVWLPSLALRLVPSSTPCRDQVG